MGQESRVYPKTRRKQIRKQIKNSFSRCHINIFLQKQYKTVYPSTENAFIFIASFSALPLAEQAGPQLEQIARIQLAIAVLVQQAAQQSTGQAAWLGHAGCFLAQQLAHTGGI